jgi:hypothetical protein
MLIAAELFRSVSGAPGGVGRALCAKIYHDATFFCAHAPAHQGSLPRCIFCRDRVRAG